MDGVISGKKSRKGTRERLLNAALELVTEDQNGLAGLSLRRISQRSGISPPAFYGHFESTDELGMTLVRESTAKLRQMLADIQRVGDIESFVRSTLDVYREFIEENMPTLLLLARERAGSSPVIRTAIREERAQIASEMAEDLHTMQIYPGLSREELTQLALAAIAMGVNAVPDLLDTPQDDPDALTVAIENLFFEVNLIAKGAQLISDERVKAQASDQAP